MIELCKVALYAYRQGIIAAGSCLWGFMNTNTCTGCRGKQQRD